MKFKTKPVEIEAWREGCGEPMPEWVKDAEKGSDDLEPIVKKSRVFVEKYQAWLNRKPTDWLIYNGPDDIYPCDEETFERKYEPIID